MTTPSLAQVLADAFEPNGQLLQPAMVGTVSSWQELWPWTYASIDRPDDQDFYLFTITAEQTTPLWLDLFIDNKDFDLDLYLYRIDSPESQIRDSYSGFAGEPESLDLAGLAAGDYVLAVLPFEPSSLPSGSGTTYQLLPRTIPKLDTNTPGFPAPIAIALHPLGAFIKGVASTTDSIPENTAAPVLVPSRSDGLLDLSTINRLSFALQADLSSEQRAALQQQPPPAPIRFRLALNDPSATNQPALESQDLLFSVVAVDSYPVPAANQAEPPPINLLPDADGFFTWPVWDQQASGRGFVIADLQIDAIPLADSLKEGTETGSFSLVDLSGSIFATSGMDPANPATKSGFLSVSDALAPPAAPSFHLDVDGDGLVTPLGDGLMIIRYLFGPAFAGAALTDKAIAPNSPLLGGGLYASMAPEQKNAVAAQVAANIQKGIDSKLLDVDQDGQITPLGDGLMLIRRLFGKAFDGAALTNKAISPSSPYFSDSTGYLAVANRIDALLPVPSVQPG